MTTTEPQPVPKGTEPFLKEPWRIAWIIANAGYASHEAGAETFEAFASSAEQWMWRFRDGLKAMPSPTERDAISAEMALRDYLALANQLAQPRNGFGSVLQGVTLANSTPLPSKGRAADYEARRKQQALDARVWNAGLAALQKAPHLA